MARARDPAVSPSSQLAAAAGRRGRTVRNAACPDRDHAGGQGRNAARDHRRGLPGAVAGHRRAGPRAGRRRATSTSCCTRWACSPRRPSTSGRSAPGGQLSTEQLIDRYGIACRPVRDVLVAYLRERQPMLDHTSLTRSGAAWAGCSGPGSEATTPASASLRLPPEVAAAWKQDAA